MLQKELSPEMDIHLVNEREEFPRSAESNKPEEKSSFGMGDSSPDMLGIGGSFLCLVHCLAPQLMALGIFGAGFGSFFAGESWAFIFWITCLWAVWRSAAASPYPLSVLALWTAFGLFSAGLACEFFFGSGQGISYSGSVFLMLAHFWNFRLQIRWKKLRRSCFPS